MTGSDSDTSAGHDIPETRREAAPEARSGAAVPQPPSAPAAPQPPAGFGQPARPAPGVAPRAVFGRRARPPGAPTPAASSGDGPERRDPVPPSTTVAAPRANPPPVDPERRDPVPPSTTVAAPGVNPPPPPPPQSAAVSPEVLHDPSKLNDEAFLAAEAIRLGIRTADEAVGSAFDSDAKLIAEARQRGLRVGEGPEKDWTVPFDEEMERTAVLLGIRSEETPAKPSRRRSGASKAVPWVVMLFLLMFGLAGVTLFLDTIIAFFAS